MSRERVQCEHCANPDRDGAPCRYFWYQPKGWPGDDGDRWQPCDYDRACARFDERRLRVLRNTALFVAFAAVLAAAWWMMAGGLEWVHLHMWMGPGQH